MKDNNRIAQKKFEELNKNPRVISVKDYELRQALLKMERKTHYVKIPRPDPFVICPTTVL